MKTDFTAIEAEVAENGSAIDSAITLLTDIKAKLDDAGTDPVKLKALSDALDANTNKLAAAVVANTPQAEEPPVEEPPVEEPPVDPGTGEDV